MKPATAASLDHSGWIARDGARENAAVIGDRLPMKLQPRRAYTLLDAPGSYITEICDRCGAGIGPVRFIRKNSPGVWCSQECRDGKETHQAGTCKHCHAPLPEGKRRGSSSCDDVCKQAGSRSRARSQRPETGKLPVTKPPIYAAFSPEQLSPAVFVRPGGSLLWCR